MRRLIGLVATAVMLLALAAPALGISYGTIDEKNKYSNVGALMAEVEGGFVIYCTGTLISSTVFLTASHCLDYDGQTMYVSFDLTIPEDEDGFVIVDELDTFYEGIAHMHPLYASGGQNDTYDIAVIVFDDPVRRITPAKLPTLNYLDTLTAKQLKTATFIAVGYGYVRDEKEGASQPLEWDPTRRYAEQTANSLTAAWFTLSMNYATGDGGTCYGDSGGPHFLGDVVVSITVTGDVWCKATDKTYRLDTQVARDFLDDYVTLP